MCGGPALARERWSPEKANAWYEKQPWLVGCNFIPSTAINQLEMWQADTFDPETIDRELGWAEGLGFNSVRVFLHHLLWEQDREGFLKRMDQFLEIADRHKIGVMFVLFDSVWDPHPKLGKQREPQPGLHNSGWVQSPGADDLMNPERHKLLEDYVTRRDRPLQGRPARPGLGHLERAGQPQRQQLRREQAEAASRPAS